jgi:DNA-binding MarR family transcriptional regulator
MRGANDRRVVVSALTAQGRARIAAKRDAWQGRWRAALAGLSDEQLEAATCVLERLATMLDEASAAAER